MAEESLCFDKVLRILTAITGCYAEEFTADFNLVIVN